MSQQRKRVLVAGATGYLGKYAVKAFKESGYFVRVLTRNKERLFEKGPFTAPALTEEDFDEVFVAQVTDPGSLNGAAEGMDLIFSSVGISRQRDGLTFEDVDYKGNKNLIDQALSEGVKRFTYVSMQGAEDLMHLEITRAHEKVVDELALSGMEYRIVRPCGYYSDMGALYDMASKGRVILVGNGSNRMNPIHGADLARVCVEAGEGDELDIVAGGPDIMTQREAAELAFKVVGRKPKITVFPIWMAKILVTLIRMLSKQFGDLADFIVTAGEVDGVGPKKGRIRLEDYFKSLRA